jgi:hypothetical protein
MGAAVYLCPAGLEALLLIWKSSLCLLQLKKAMQSMICTDVMFTHDDMKRKP